MYVPLTINLEKNIFCNHICRKLCLVPIWVFCLIHACVQDGAITGHSNWKPILVPQTSHHLIKFSSITVSWYGKFHVQVCVIIYIRGEVIFVLWNTGSVNYSVELLMEVWVVFQVLVPVLWVIFTPSYLSYPSSLKSRLIQLSISLMMALPSSV